MAEVAAGRLDPRMAPAWDLIGRTGARESQLRYSDDEQPVVWMAVAIYDDGRAEAAAALHPLHAVFRLCSQLLDGGMCKHCGKPSGFSEAIDALPLESHVCWYQWDPELVTFRRGCAAEGR